MTRILVALSIAAGLLYPLTGELLGLKGAAVGLLALAAGLAARSPDGWLLALVLGFGAVGDVLLELSFLAGVAAFACGHVVALALYLRNRRGGLLLPALLLVAGAAMPVLVLPAEHPMVVPFTVYSLLLTGMAAAAWASRFPRIVPLGAILFVVSDGLIAARFGPLAGAGWAGPAIWMLYYCGQLLVFLGVRRGLGRA